MYPGDRVLRGSVAKPCTTRLREDVGGGGVVMFGDGDRRGYGVVAKAVVVNMVTMKHTHRDHEKYQLNNTHLQQKEKQITKHTPHLTMPQTQNSPTQCSSPKRNPDVLNQN